MQSTKTKASKAPVPMCAALATTLSEFRHETPYDKEEDFVFASPTLNGKQRLWGQTMNAQFVKPAAVELGLVAEEDRFGWHRFRHIQPLASGCLFLFTEFPARCPAR